MANFSDWITLPLSDIPSKPEVGGFLDVKLLDIAGLVFRKESELLYCRKETLHLWEELSKWSVSSAEDLLSVVGLVRGPPGTGKSTTTFAWTQALVSSEGKSVTWFHVDSGNVVYRVDFEKKNSDVAYRTRGQKTINTLEEEIRDCTSAVLVLDGVKGNDTFKSSLSPSVRVWAGMQAGKRTAVLVSSGAAQELHIEDSVNSQTRNEMFQNWSWTLEDYVCAFKRARLNSNFGERVTKKRFVESTPGNTAAVVGRTDLNDGILSDIDDKYFYAGGCARYFFGFSTDAVKSDITSAVNSLNKTNIAEVLNTGTSHDETRHRLISLFRPNENGNDTKSIVSQFTVQKLVEHAGEKAILFLYGMGATNPAFDGWVFEADFFFQCERALATTVPLVLQGKPDFKLKLRPFFTVNHDDLLGRAHPLNARCTKPLLKHDENRLRSEI